MKTKVISVLTKLTIMVFFTVYLTGCDDPVEKVSSVSLDKTTLALKEGENETLKATVLPAGAGNKKITWKSDDSNIASVDQTGKVTAVKAGSAKVTVTTEDGGKTASCAVTVTTVAVTGVTIAPSEDTNLKVGSTLTVTATVSPANAKDRDVTWSGYDATATPVGSIKASDDKTKEIASYTMLEGTITVTGVALGAGILTVTTKDGNHSDTLKITVVAKTDATIAVTAVTLDPSADFDLQTGEKANLMATVEPDNATDKTLTWTSGNEAIVTVDNGVVTGVAVGGPIEIIVTSNSDQSIADTLKVTVKANVSVTGVTVDPTEKTDLKVDETFEVMAMVEPFGSLQTVTWSGYDADATPPGSIKASDDDAKVIATYTMGTDGKLTVTGKAVGEGKLIVTTTDVNHSDTLNITVVGTGTSPIVTISLPNGVANATLTAVGETLQLSASAEPVVDGATFAWSSSDDKVAIVDQTGKVTAVSHGTATITADYNDGNKETIDIIVNIPVTGVTITNHDGGAAIEDDPYYLGVDSTLVVMAMVEPADATDKTVTWSGYDATATPPAGSIKNSDGATIATYTIGEDKKLTVIGTAPGSGKLTVITTNKVHKAELNIRVATITISHSNGMETSVTLNEVGENASTLQFSAVMVPNEDAEFVWKSSNTAFAIVEETTGLVRAVASGKTKITATYNGITSNEIEVTVPTVTISLPDGVTSATLTEVGDDAPTLALLASVDPSDENAVFAWFSSDTDVATVADGVVTAVGSGKADITATYNGITSNDIAVYIVKVKFNPTNDKELVVGSTLDVEVVVSPAGATDKTLTWSGDNGQGKSYDVGQGGSIKSVDDAVLEIASYTITETGVRITAIATGNGTLKVTINNGSHAELNINVVSIPTSIIITHSNGIKTPVEISPGNTIGLTAEPVLADLASYDAQAADNFVWSSTNTDVATVDQKGVVTSVAVGDAFIQVKYRGVDSNKIEINVGS